MNKLKMQTPNLVDKNVEQIAGLFPEVITEIKDKEGNIIKGIDFDLLKQKLSHVLVEEDNERYRLDWPGKKASLLKANTPITRTLRPVVEESVNFDKTENLYIEGDNFEVLKILQESYLGKVKMIYIDPPYNTGKDFIFKDDYKTLTTEYENEIGAIDDEGVKLFKNTDSNGRFHSDWLKMMCERLIISRDLLTQDGVIFISIDDNEAHNLRKICDDIFGEDNFRGDIIRATGTTTGQDAKKIGSSYDHTICYAKSESFKLGGLPLVGKDLNRFNNDDNDGKGKYALLQLRKTGNADRKEDRENMFYSIKAPDETDVYPIGPTDYLSRWRVAKSSYEKLLKDNLIIWKYEDNPEEIDDLSEEEVDDYSFENDENTMQDENKNFDILKIKSKWRPYVKYYLSGRTKQVSNLWTDIEGNKKGSISLKELFGKKIFDNPKPVGFINRLVVISTGVDDIILDFFSGSATSAHSIFYINAELRGQRKFILTQIVENIDEKTEAFKMGFKTISDIGKERIRRAGKKIQEEFLDKHTKELEKVTKELLQASLLENEELKAQKSELESKIAHIKNLDIGFRVYKTDSSNMKDVFYHPTQLKQNQLTAFESNIKDDRTPEDLLTQVILDLGLELSLPITKKKLKNNTVFFVQENALIACFDDKIDFSIVDSIAEIKPLKVVFKDASFKDDKDRINVEERFKRLSPETIITVL